MIREGSNQSTGAASLHHASKDAGRKSSLLGRLAGQGRNVGTAAASMSAVDLQNALATSFGAQAVVRANKAMRK